MEMLVGRNDGAGDFRPSEELAVVLRDEIDADLFRDIEPAVVIPLGNPDPLHRRMACSDLAAKQSHATRPDNRKADAFRLSLHALAPIISATAESDSFESGRSTGALRCAERSAAV